MAFGGSLFGPGPGPIFYDEVQCLGSEERLSDCRSYDGSGCSAYYEAVGIACTDTPPERGVGESRGRVWGMLCAFGRGGEKTCLAGQMVWGRLV